MKKLKLNQLARIGALASTLLLGNPVQAADDCPILPQEQVIQVFSDPAVRLIRADAAGVCNWTFSGGDVLLASIQKRPNAAEAKLLYDSYKATALADFKNHVRTPTLGKEAYFATGANGQAALIALQGDTMFILNYGAVGALDERVGAQLLALGKSVIENKDKAAQSFGKCEWFNDQEIARFVGKTRVTVQRLGPDSCIASALPNGGVLSVSSGAEIDEEFMRLMKENAAKSCTVLSLPAFGEHAYAAFACAAPGNKAVQIVFLKNSAHVTFNYAPAAERAASEADVKALGGLVQRAYERETQP